VVRAYQEAAAAVIQRAEPPGRGWQHWLHTPGGTRLGSDTAPGTLGAEPGR
jgi:hypothetical protein